MGKVLIAMGMFVVGRNLVMGKVGGAMMAVRDHRTAAAAMGIDNSLLKTKTFGVSAMYTGVAGVGIHGVVSAITARIASRSKNEMREGYDD